MKKVICSAIVMIVASFVASSAMAAAGSMGGGTSVVPGTVGFTSEDMIYTMDKNSIASGLLGSKWNFTARQARNDDEKRLTFEIGFTREAYKEQLDLIIDSLENGTVVFRAERHGNVSMGSGWAQTASMTSLDSCEIPDDRDVIICEWKGNPVDGEYDGDPVLAQYRIIAKLTIDDHKSMLTEKTYKTPFMSPQEFVEDSAADITASESDCVGSACGSSQNANNQNETDWDGDENDAACSMIPGSTGQSGMTSLLIGLISMCALRVTRKKR